MNRILFVNLQGRIAGAERSLLLLVRHLSSRFDKVVACPAGSPLSAKLQSMGVACIGLGSVPVRSLRSVLSLPYLLVTIGQLAGAASRLKPDIIHANSFYAAAVSLAAGRMAGTKTILHGRDLNKSRLSCRILGRGCEKIIAVSTAVKNLLVEYGTDPGKIEVVHNGVESDIFARCPPAFSSKKKPFVFANIGQFVPWKNHAAFLKSASLVGGKLPNAEFVVVGDDVFGRNRRYKRTLLQQVKDSPAAEKISILGWQPDMEQVWYKVDCLVHTACREPFGRVIIEAMAHRLPVIAADSAGPCEIIEDGRTGLLVNPERIEQLSGAMLRVARDRDFAERLAQAGYEHVKAKFSAALTAASIEGIYREVIAR